MALSVTSSAAAAITDASKAKAAANPIRPCIPLLPSLLVVPAHMQQEEHTLVPIRNLPCAAAAAAGPGKREGLGIAPSRAGPAKPPRHRERREGLVGGRAGKPCPVAAPIAIRQPATGSAAGSPLPAAGHRPPARDWRRR